MSEKFLGFDSLIQEGKQFKDTSDRGCKKKGIEYLEVPHFSLGGLTTLCVVDFSLLLVKR